MEDPLYNPVYNALLSHDAHLGAGTGKVKYFHEAVAPFAGFPTDYADGFKGLFDQLPPGREIVYARPDPIGIPAGWQELTAIHGFQFLFMQEDIPPMPPVVPEPLNDRHISEMIELVRLTRPGPFGLRTIEFGHYHGFFDQGKLVAMAGQRMHIGNFTEISAVCTHPDHLGKGYAASLLTHQIQLIRSYGQQPFLHVRDDNKRAIAVYERLGFEINRPMHFYFLKRKQDR